MSNKSPVFIDEGISCKNGILGAFSEAAGAVHIASQAAGALLADE